MTKQLIYITSPSYSGSTLLTILLAEHPRIATIGELKASAFGDISNYICSCGRPLEKCSFWLELEQQILRRNPTFELLNWQTHFTSETALAKRTLQTPLKNGLFEGMRTNLIRFIPNIRHRFEAVLQLNVDVIDAVCSLAQKDIFLDGSKDPIRANYLINSNKWDVFLIVLLRDGRGTVNSHMRHVESNAKEASLGWSKKINEIKNLSKMLPPNRIKTVKYEDLCRDPHAIVESIYKFSNISPHQISLPLSPANRHIFGNEMRLKTVTELKNDTKWRHQMDKHDLHTFDAIAGSINREFEYID